MTYAKYWWPQTGHQYLSTELVAIFVGKLSSLSVATWWTYDSNGQYSILIKITIDLWLACLQFGTCLACTELLNTVRCRLKADPTYHNTHSYCYRAPRICLRFTNCLIMLCHCQWSRGHRPIQLCFMLLSHLYPAVPTKHLYPPSVPTHLLYPQKVASWCAVECRIRDQEVAGPSLGRALRRKISGQVSHTYVPLSPSSITWYWPEGSDAWRLGR